MCRTCCSICTLCTASGTSWRRPSLQEWTAGRRGGLRREKCLNTLHLSKNTCCVAFLISLLLFTWTSTVRAGHQLLWLASLVISFGVSQTEITVIIRQREPIWTFLWSCVGRWKHAGQYQWSVTPALWPQIINWRLLRIDIAPLSLTFWLLGQRQGGLVHFHVVFLLTLLLGQVGVGVVVAQARTVLVALPTDCHQNHKIRHVWYENKEQTSQIGCFYHVSGGRWGWLMEKRTILYSAIMGHLKADEEGETLPTVHIIIISIFKSILRWSKDSCSSVLLTM